MKSSTDWKLEEVSTEGEDIKDNFEESQASK